MKQFIDYCRPFYPTWDDDFCKQLLEEFQLPLDRKLRNLSRGIRIKAALIGGIAYRPKLVILDEPFSGLDSLVRDEFIRGLLRMRGEEGWTVFLSSHDIEEVERLADRVILIDSGRKRIDESIEKLLKKCRHVDVTCAEDPPDFELPADWMGFHQLGRTLSFGVASANGNLEEKVRAAIPDAERIEARKMSLCEAFVMMAEQFRLEN